MKLFRFPSGNPLPTKAQIEQALDTFAELLSLDHSLNDIAASMSISRGTACVFLRMICDRLGAQAA